MSVSRVSLVACLIFAAGCGGSAASSGSTAGSTSTGTTGGTSTSTTGSTGSGSSVEGTPGSFTATLSEGWYATFSDGGVDSSSAFISLDDGSSSCSADQSGFEDMSIVNDFFIALENAGGTVGAGTYSLTSQGPQAVTELTYLYGGDGGGGQVYGYSGTVTLTQASSAGFAGSFTVLLSKPTGETDAGTLSGSFNAGYCQLPNPSL